jgi:hypothetical protein
MSEDLKYFVGKPCTVTTVAINWRYDVEPMMDYFFGIVDKIDENGIMLTHVVTKSKNYIFLKHVVSICEEQFVNEDDPKHKEMIEEYRARKPEVAAKTRVAASEPKIIVPPPPPAPPRRFVDAKSLSNMAKMAKENFGPR